ncbi:MAG: uroporphyrinogen decarboxylase family protein [Opitutales bacterium]
MAARVGSSRRALGRARRRRCEAALVCEAPDRAPLYLPAVSCGVASAVLGRAAIAGTGSLHFAEVAAWADGADAHAEFETRLTEDLVAVHRSLDADVLRLPWRMNRRPDARLDEHTFRFGPEAGEYTVWQYQPATGDFSPVYASPPKVRPEERLRRTVEQLEASLGDPRATAQEVEPVIRLQRDFGDEFFVIGASAHIGVGLAPEDLELLVTEPDLVRRWCLLQADFAIAVGRALLAGGCPPVILGGGDLAGSLGPFYSPVMFRALVLPAYVKALAALNAQGVHYIFRSDGNLWPLVGMLFGEAGCPGYGETDRDALMTVAAVRAQFPRLVIWGNVSSALLARGTPAQVRAQAQAALAEAGGRGYFQGCSNALIQGTPLENVRALCAVR